jgi:hypothetical protein
MYINIGELFVTKKDANVVLNEIDMAKVLNKIPANVPILLLHGTDDELIGMIYIYMYIYI